MKCCPTDNKPAACDYLPHGESMYMAGSIESKKGVVLVGDIFGMHHNSHRYADILAEAGFLVIMPDFFGKHAWSPDNWPPDYSSEKWMEFRNYCSAFDTIHLPKARKAVSLLRKIGCTKIASIGMCWGSGLAFDLAAENLVDAAATCHPSILSDASIKKANVPICVMLSKDEPPFVEVEAACKANKLQPNVYVRYDQLSHGFFGSRFDPSKASDAETKQIQDATKESISFLQQALAC